MKSLAITVLVLLIAVTPLGAVAADESIPENMTAILTNPENVSATDPGAATTPIASALDLSLFGIISLGVLGLFWIRRHTSEL